MLIDKNTKVYYTNKDYSVPDFGIPEKTYEIIGIEEISFVMSTTMGEIADRIRYNKLDIDEILLSTDPNIILAYIYKKETEANPSVPWQSFN